jgi:Family of unknown function (DUF5994)
MTTSIDSSDPTTARARLRLHLIPTLGAGADDGVWWPQSRDFAVEAADLVDHFPRHFGQVNRVVFSRPDWDSVPHRLAVSRGLIKVGSYPTDDGHRLMLAMSDRRLIRLRVKAVDAGPEDSEQSQPTGHAGQPAGDPADAGESGEWTDGGGSWWGSGEVAPSHRV